MAVTACCALLNIHAGQGGICGMPSEGQGPSPHHLCGPHDSTLTPMSLPAVVTHAGAGQRQPCARSALSRPCRWLLSAVHQPQLWRGWGLLWWQELLRRLLGRLHWWLRGLLHLQVRPG